MGYIAAERTALAGILDAAPSLSTLTVWPYSQPVERVDTHTVIVSTAKVVPASVAVPGRTLTLELWLISPATEVGVSDDALEDALEAVLAVLDANAVEWTNAEPAVWRDIHPAFRIEVEII
jgi:hypothetical protein